MTAGLLAALVSGLLFGLGLAISHMTDRFVVLGFLDLFGDWNPTLAFVLAGAVAVTAIAFRFVLRRSRPLLSDRFQIPVDRAVDRPLLLGAAIFGIGWGLVGFCPGPALAGFGGGLQDAFWFLPAMLAGSYGYRLLDRARSTAT